MNNKMLTKFILAFLVEKEDYLELSQTQQQLVFETCKTIMKAIYHSIKFENVFPIILCGDVEAKVIISKAIKTIEPILPSTDKITVSLIH